MELLKDGDQVFVIERESEMYRKTGRVDMQDGVGPTRTEGQDIIPVTFPDSPRRWYFKRRGLLKLIY